MVLLVEIRVDERKTNLENQRGNTGKNCSGLRFCLLHWEHHVL